MISVIVPAYNEQGYIGECLGHLLGSYDPLMGDDPVDLIVVANGCKDDTVAEARSLAGLFQRKGWRFRVLDLPMGSKPRAMNAGCDAALHPNLLFIDADVHVSPGLVARIAETLDRPDPAYASGIPSIRPARSAISQRYAQFWSKLPFMNTGVPGCGVFGVNAAGHARWHRVPDVIADDMFIRHHFHASEMHQVPHGYSWPISEGLCNLVRMRRRQNEGLSELARLMPDLVASSERTSPDLRQLAALFAKDPVGFVTYASVALTVRSPFVKNRTRWDRGRDVNDWHQIEEPGE